MCLPDFLFKTGKHCSRLVLILKFGFNSGGTPRGAGSFVTLRKGKERKNLGLFVGIPFSGRAKKEKKRKNRKKKMREPFIY
jgi:hypothetical protein